MTGKRKVTSDSGKSARKRVRSTKISEKKYKKIKEKYARTQLTPSKFGVILQELSDGNEDDTDEFDSDDQRENIESAEISDSSIVSDDDDDEGFLGIVCSDDEYGGDAGGEERVAGVESSVGETSVGGASVGEEIVGEASVGEEIVGEASVGGGEASVGGEEESVSETVEDSNVLAGRGVGERGRGRVRVRGGRQRTRARGRTSRPRGRIARVTHARTDDSDWKADNVAPFVDLFTAQPGIKVDIPTTPLGFVQLFLNRNFIKYLCVETNRYAHQSLVNASAQERGNWDEVNIKEMGNFLGLTMLMGMIKAPQMIMYWQVNKNYHVPIFNRTMSRRRFQAIARYFHSCNNAAIPHDNTDRLIKVRTVMEYFQNKFKASYCPNKKLSLDEGTLAWRGRLAFRVYNPQKPDKYGVKLFIVAESKTGYVFDYEVYCGIGKSTTETVMQLMAPLTDHGYHLYMDNYYNSVDLSDKLHDKGIYTCGTLRVGRGAPKYLKVQTANKMKDHPRGTTLFRRKDNLFILLWKDKRVVSLITNCHDAGTQEIQRRERVRNADGTTSIRHVTLKKPKAICDYNDHMKGVDHFDQMVKYYHFTRKCHKWTKKIVYYFIQMAIHNAFVLYKQYTPSEKKMTMLEFHDMVSDKLIHFDHDEWPCTDDIIPHAEDQPLSEMPDSDVDDPGEGTSSGSVTVPRPSPATGARRGLQFLPQDLPSSTEDDVDDPQEGLETTPTGTKRKPRVIDDNKRLQKNILHNIVAVESSKRKRCRVCFKSGKRKDTRHKCRACDVFLCMEPCFSLYHTKKVYWDKH